MDDFDVNINSKNTKVKDKLTKSKNEDSKNSEKSKTQKIQKDVPAIVDFEEPANTNKGTVLTNAVANTPTSTPVKPNIPIDRSGLPGIYRELMKESGEKAVLNLIVVGHVDAGKSTLMGNLLCQLHYVSDKQLSKFQWEAQKLGKGSFAFAWVLDQTGDERSRGVTMDIAQTSFETDHKKVVLLDAPGHKDFVPQVIGGAAQADYAILVINSTRGEFETGFESSGQTREHARLLRLLGVQHVIVAVNKLDTVDWSEARFEEIKSKLTSFFKTLNMTNVQYCPLSGLLGVNVTSTSAKWCKNKNSQSSESDIRVLAPWYKDKSLLELIDDLPVVDREVDAPFRFVVNDIFKPVGSSLPAVAGKVISGGVTGGVNLNTSKVLCKPSGHSAIVKSIRSLSAADQQSSEGRLDDSSMGANLLTQNIKGAFSGDQVVLFLQNIDPYQSLRTGDLLCDPDNPISVSTRIRAKLLVFSLDQPITRGYPVVMYHHCSSFMAHISSLISCTERKNKQDTTRNKPRCLVGNCQAEVEIIFEYPVCIELYEKCKPLGRFMLRVGSQSIAGGTVTAILPPKKSKSDAS